MGRGVRKVVPSGFGRVIERIKKTAFFVWSKALEDLIC
tara:strand:- start:197 stop:310 length:114 start_codon:yes stop_codon:yes gene_type:complete